MKISSIDCVVCYSRVCRSRQPGHDVLPEQFAPDAVHDARVSQHALPLEIRWRRGTGPQEHPVSTPETLSPTTGTVVITALTAHQRSVTVYYTVIDL